MRYHLASLIKSEAIKLSCKQFRWIRLGQKWVIRARIFMIEWSKTVVKFKSKMEDEWKISTISQKPR